MRTEGIKGHAMNSSYADRHLQPEEGAQEQELQTDGEGWKTETDSKMTRMGHSGAQPVNCVGIFAMGHRKMFFLIEWPMNSAISS